MTNISYVDRYESRIGADVYFVHYDSGDIDQYEEATLPKAVRLWLGRAEGFHFRRNKQGEFYHRWTEK
jgi:hypothetical protein